MLPQIIVIATLAATAFSASTSGGGALAALPACAQTCLQNATASQGSCESVDIHCLCNSVTYLNSFACCLSQNCDQADQTAATNFNSQVCGNVNVTVSFSIGCPSETTTDSRGSLTTILTNRLGATVNDQGAFPTNYNNGSVEAGPSVATTGPVATFTGKPLLTGTCTIPQIATTTLNAGEILEYPWMGCSEEAPECCPFNINVGGKLSICPQDYFTTSNACCPTGWSVYTSALAGETPCYTTSSPAVQSPNATLSASGASVSMINTEVFTLRYALRQRQQSALSVGAKVGIAVGAACGGALALIALAIFIRKRRAQKRAQREEANMPKPESGNMYQGGFNGSQPAVSELPSPHTIRPPTPPLPDNAIWFNTPLGSHAPGRVMTPTELAGSTYINEHHPAYGVSPVTPNVNGFHDVPGPPEELAGDDLMRGTVSRETARTELVTRGEGAGSSPLSQESERAGGAG
ncbi:hypothetical protein HO173_003914 [Letharia columbiana]|uniref:CFEM domain-containing protein n=1 Tax=Letharia columbiana TaxID=112416 RepID=A0A8H6L6P4_9LECA|nr:uncharacterized protein HO173_003914 [Letharia columbiana]KAF6237713.1 hypothetical protein HO173_003914 [Letharia columbiana]